MIAEAEQEHGLVADNFCPHDLNFMHHAGLLDKPIPTPTQ